MSKRLIVCADGTWNTPDQKDDAGNPCPTNVVKFHRMLAARDAQGREQCKHYHDGVGTGGWVDRLVGGMTGKGISRNIVDCYRFLVDNYEDGDDVLLFGFSRGAYTVRSLAGLIRNVGMLRREFAGKADEAYALYRSKDDDDAPWGKNAKQFRAAYAREIRIQCVGVWDTVGSLGIPAGGFEIFGVPIGTPRFIALHGQRFHDVELSSYIDNAFQALAVDERRVFFKPAVWKTKDVPGQRVEQAWFAGVHCNVGGGYAECGLSDLTLRWMMEKAHSCGLAFDEATCTIAPNYAGRLENSKTGFYRLTRDYLRPIGTRKDAREAAHASAVERYTTIREYKPKNLGDFLERRPPSPDAPPAQQPIT